MDQRRWTTDTECQGARGLFRVELSHLLTAVLTQTMPDLHGGTPPLQTWSSVLPPDCLALSSDCLWWWRWSNIGMLTADRSLYAHPLLVARKIILPGRHFPNMHVLPNAELLLLLTYYLSLALCLQPLLETLRFLLTDQTDPVLCLPHIWERTKTMWRYAFFLKHFGGMLDSFHFFRVHLEGSDACCYDILDKSNLYEVEPAKWSCWVTTVEWCFCQRYGPQLTQTKRLSRREEFVFPQIWSCFWCRDFTFLMTEKL